jgi:hypothetical protein
VPGALTQTRSQTRSLSCSPRFSGHRALCWDSSATWRAWRVVVVGNERRAVVWRLGFGSPTMTPPAAPPREQLFVPLLLLAAWLTARSPASCCTVRAGTRGWSGRPGPRAAAAVLAARVLTVDVGKHNFCGGCRRRAACSRYAMSCRTARLRPQRVRGGVLQSACAPAPHRASLLALPSPQPPRSPPRRRLRRGRLRTRQNWRACARA